MADGDLWLYLRVKTLFHAFCRLIHVEGKFPFERGNTPFGRKIDLENVVIDYSNLDARCC